LGALVPLLYTAGDRLDASFATDPAWWALIVSLSALYWFHAYIWYRPAEFTALSKGPLKALGATPVQVFGKLEILFKFQQIGSIIAFWGSAHVLSWPPTMGAAAFALLLVVGGQALNVATYAAIGEAGVYYGFKLGETVPWAYGFPFNTGLRHPQYTGVVLTLWGLGMWYVTAPTFVESGLLAAVAVWAGMYVVMSWMEQSGDNDTKAK
jgi:hypothetical protein